MIIRLLLPLARRSLLDPFMESSRPQCVCMCPSCVREVSPFQTCLALHWHTLSGHPLAGLSPLSTCSLSRSVTSVATCKALDASVHPLCVMVCENPRSAFRVIPSEYLKC